MTSGVYKRTPEMKTGKYKRTPECNAINSKSKKGIPHSPEHNAAISTATLGIPKSPEHCAAISEGVKNSDAAKAESDRQRGGNDLVTHHYIYDHANPEKYTMKVTRSKHGQIHAWMRKAGIKVPHINEDAGEWGCDQ